MPAEIRTKFVTLEGNDLQNPKLITRIMQVCRPSYKKFWLGNRSFLEQTLPNTTKILCLIDDKEAFDPDAVAVYNGDRMLMLAAKEVFKGSMGGYKPGQLIVTEALEQNPRTWMTASTDEEAHAMIGLLSKPEYSLRLVRSIDEIRELYRNTQNSHPFDYFEAEMIEHRVLARRYKGEREFLAFWHSRSVHSIHKKKYMQVAFQHLAA